MIKVTKQHFVLNALLFIIWVSCILFFCVAVVYSNDNTNSEEAQYKKNVVIMYCDLTASVDSTQIKDIATHIGQLILQLPPESEYVIFPVSCTQKAPVIDQGMLPPKPVNRRIELSKYQRYKFTLAKEAALKTDTTYFTTYMNDSSVCSCVMNSFVSAQRYINSYSYADLDNFVFDIVFISDMYEDCHHSDLGRLNFRRSDFNESYQALGQLTELDNLYSARITVIVPASSARDDAISSEELIRLWEVVFTRYGVNPEVFQQLHFQPTFPRKFKDSTYWQVDKYSNQP